MAFFKLWVRSDVYRKVLEESPIIISHKEDKNNFRSVCKMESQGIVE